jgi:type IV fimbrial biogenesis protein FimT
MMKYFPASRGFTLVELLITIAIVAILMTIAVPSYRDMVMRNRVSAASSELLAAINLARSEAVTRGAKVTLEGSLSDGWTIGTGTGTSAVVIHERVEALAGVEATEGDPFELAFDRLGGTTPEATITLKAENCPKGLKGGQRKIEIAVTGRVKNTSEDCPP